MNQNQHEHEHKEFLEQQLQWTEEQVRILDEMNVKLHEMKRIAENASEHELSPIETDRLNAKLDVLKNEFGVLVKQFYPVFH